jgi:peptide deformylase
MILEVLKFPDPRLRKKGEKVPAVTPELKALAENMLETMHAENGIGLAAPQVGQSVRLLVIDTRPRDDDGNVVLEQLTELERAVNQPVVLFNPEIVASKDKTSYEEGCLSVPGFFETVDRFNYVEVKGLDIDGNEILIKTDGLLSICLQHEMDHLDGKLFIDRLSFVKSSRIKNRIQKHGYPTADEVAEERAEIRAKRKEIAMAAQGRGSDQESD